MKAIVGLGNVGQKYAKTRHNIGFMAVDQLAQALNIQFKDNGKLQALIGTGQFEGEKVILIKPTTMMNDSGKAVRAVQDYYDLAVADFLVIVDDIDRVPGAFRMKKSGSSGGHNGLKSITQHLGTENYDRIRLGVGRPVHQQQAVVDHVLGEFTKSEQAQIQPALESAVLASQDWLTGKAFNQITNTYNQ